MQLSHSPQVQERSEEYNLLAAKIWALAGNMAFIEKVDEWRAKLFQLCLKRLSDELEWEEEHWTSYSMMRLNNFFATQLRVTQVGEELPHSQDSTYGITGLDEIIAIQEEIMKVENHGEKIQLDRMLVSLFRNKNTTKILESYGHMAKEMIEPKPMPSQKTSKTRTWLQGFKDRLLSLVRSE